MTTISWRQSENKNKRRSGSRFHRFLPRVVFPAFSFSRVSAHTEKRSLPIRKIIYSRRGCNLIIESRGLMRDDKKILGIFFHTEMKCSKDRNRSLSAIYFRARNLSFGLPCASLYILIALYLIITKMRITKSPWAYETPWNNCQPVCILKCVKNQGNFYHWYWRMI